MLNHINRGAYTGEPDNWSEGAAIWNHGTLPVILPDHSGSFPANPRRKRPTETRHDSETGIIRRTVPNRHKASPVIRISDFQQMRSAGMRNGDPPAETGKRCPFGFNIIPDHRPDQFIFCDFHCSCDLANLLFSVVCAVVTKSGFFPGKRGVFLFFSLYSTISVVYYILIFFGMK